MILFLYPLLNINFLIMNYINKINNNKIPWEHTRVYLNESFIIEMKPIQYIV